MPTFSETIDLLRAGCKREDGQTMAEYGVTLAVITLGVLSVFTLLSDGVQGTLNRVIGLLPG